MNLLDMLTPKRVIFVGGKGGVGKTTSAAALAVYFARAGSKTLVISTDPAHNLGDAFAVALSHNPTRVAEGLDAVELNPKQIIHRHFKQVERTLEGYAKPEMMPKVREFLRLSHHAPGAEEAAMLEAICQQLLSAQAMNYQHIIFDTAPTGHTLRLLSLPEIMQAWTDGLLTQQRRQSKLRGAADMLDKNYNSNPLATEKTDRWSSAVQILEKRRQLFAKTRLILHDSTQTAIVLVMIPETLPLAETERTVAQLKAGNLPCTGLIVNQVIPPAQSETFWQQRALRQQQILTRLDKSLNDLPQLHIPLQAKDICGIDALSELFRQI